MDHNTFLFTMSAFSQVSGTIFAILLGFTIFLLTQKERLNKIAYILLLTGILGSIICCGVSIHALATSDATDYSEGAVQVAEFFLMITLIAVAVLAVFTIHEIREKAK